jgi:hypothetical protein
VVVELDRGYDQVEGVAEGVQEVEELEDHELVVMMARVEEVELVEVRPGQLVMVGLHWVMVTVCVMVDVEVVVSS